MIIFLNNKKNINSNDKGNSDDDDDDDIDAQQLHNRRTITFFT